MKSNPLSQITRQLSADLIILYTHQHTHPGGDYSTVSNSNSQHTRSIIAFEIINPNNAHGTTTRLFRVCAHGLWSCLLFFFLHLLLPHCEPYFCFARRFFMRCHTHSFNKYVVIINQRMCTSKRAPRTAHASVLIYPLCNVYL